MPKSYELLFGAWFRAVCTLTAEDKNLTPEEVRAIARYSVECLGLLCDMEKKNG